MELSESKKIMEDRGYTIHYTDANRRMVSMTKTIDKLGVTIHAEIRDGENTVKLSTILGLFSIVTPKITITHPRFKDMFEDKLISVTRNARFADAWEK